MLVDVVDEYDQVENSGRVVQIAKNVSPRAPRHAEEREGGF